MGNQGAAAILRISCRNLARHKVKTVITVLAVTVSVCLYIFMDGWLLGMNIESRRNIVNYETGAAKIQGRAYFEKKDELPMYESFADWERYAEALDAAGYHAAPRFVFTGTLYSETGSAPMEFIALDPDAEAKVLRYSSWMEAGRFVKNGAFEIALGTMAAEKLHTGIPQRPLASELDALLAAIPGEADRSFVAGLYERAAAKKAGLYSAEDSSPADDPRLVLKGGIPGGDLARCWDILAAMGRMSLRISTVIDIKEGSAIRHVNQLIDVIVVGTVNSPDPVNNANVGYLPLDALQDEAGLMLGGHVTELLVRAKNSAEGSLPGKTESAAVIRAALDAALPGAATLPPELGVYPWVDYAGDYIAVSSAKDVSSRIIILLLFILSFLGIANTMLMAILERTKEIGMMRAMGMTDGQLLMAYMLEAGMVGLIGSLAGMLLGCLINIPMVRYGVDFSGFTAQTGGDIGYRISSNFRSAWNAPVIIGSGAAATLLASLMAFFPTRRALRMPVTESLRFE
jgi:ABC-type lipoprotein release transport system permease subunit